MGPEAFAAKIIEPPADVPEGAPAPTTATRDPLPPGGTVTVVYRGAADVADLKGPSGLGESTFRFRPGEPVVVPSEVAEELLTWPGEQFALVTTEE